MPFSTPRRWTARRLPAVVAVAALPLLSACSAFSPATTTVPYNPANGTSVQLGQLEGADLLVVGSEKGGTGVLSGALVNKGAEELTVAISTQGAPTPVTVTVPAQRMVRLTADSATSTAASAPTGSASATATVLVPSLPVAPGGVVTVQLATRSGGQTQLTVPVLLPQDEYATITAPPSPTATAQPTQSPTGEPAPSGNESANPTTSPS